ncbi:MAG: zonular occludens toxin domain-containing protein [Coriobacteriales bacterium]|jgi:hypothetical protein|nr:zonular occludens toxin domain-containing protein [Coriobacteriales bacterium]
MIYAYTGTPGSGKTLRAVKELVNFTGKRVITNIALSGINYLQLPDSADLLTEMCLEVCSRKEAQTLVVIDEAQMLFNCRDWSNASRSGWLKFFTHHRKYGAKIILVTQSLSYLDKQIRQLVEYEHRYRRLSRWGWVGFVLYFLTFGEKYLYVEYYAPANERVSLHISMIGRKYYKYYDTFDIPNRDRESGDTAVVSRLAPAGSECPLEPGDDTNVVLDYTVTTRENEVVYVCKQCKTLWQFFVSSKDKLYSIIAYAKGRIRNAEYVTPKRAQAEEDYWRENLS